MISNKEDLEKEVEVIIEAMRNRTTDDSHIDSLKSIISSLSNVEFHYCYSCKEVKMIEENGKCKECGSYLKL